MEPKYPYIEVELVDGNAFSILASVRRELQRHRVPRKEIDEFLDEARSGDYDHLLRVVMETVELI